MKEKAILLENVFFPDQVAPRSDSPQAGGSLPTSPSQFSSNSRDRCSFHHTFLGNHTYHCQQHREEGFALALPMVHWEGQTA